MKQEHVRLIAQLLERVDLKGREVPAYIEALKALQAAVEKETPVVTPNDSGE